MGESKFPPRAVEVRRDTFKPVSDNPDPGQAELLKRIVDAFYIRDEVTQVKAREALEAQQQSREEASRLLGYALFNLAKGNTSAVETLVRKAFKELTGKEWDE